MSKETSLKSNIVYNILYQIVILVFPLITAPYISRVLGASQLGQFSYINTIANYFVLFAMLGLNNYGNRSIARVRDNQSKLDKTFSEIYTLQIFISIVIVVIYIIFLNFVNENRILYFIQLIHIISALFDVNWFCYGIENFKITLERNILVRSINLVMLLFFVKSETDLLYYTIIMCWGYLLSALVLWPSILKKVHYKRPHMYDVLKHLKPNLVLFIPVIAISLYKYMDKLMLGMMCVKSEVGFYDYAEQIVSIPESIVLAIGTVLMPRMSNVFAKGNKEKTHQILDTSFEFSMLLATAFAFGLAAIGEEFAILFYGAEYARCGFFIEFLSPVIILVTWSSTFRTQHIIPIGKDRIYLITVISGAVVNLVINLLLIPKFNGFGAIGATIVAEFIVCFVQFMFIACELNFRKYIKNTISFIVIGIIMLIIIKMIPSISNIIIIDLIIRIIAGALTYIIGIVVYYYFIKKDTTLLKMSLNMVHIKRKGEKI